MKNTNGLKFYIRTKLPLIILLMTFAVVFAVSFALYRLPVEAVIYPTLLCLVFGTAFLIYRYSRVKDTCKKLELISEMKAETIESLPQPDTLCEYYEQEIIFALKNEVICVKANADAEYRDMIDYYTVWAHQIKTPISSMKLTLQNEDSELSRRLRSDLFRTQQYVDMVLAFLRMGSESGDYVFREYSLDSIIKPSIKKFASEFIGRKLTLTYEPIEDKFITDEKWFAFLFEQLLSNALKYTREGGITVYMAGNDTLCIRDTGIGISKEDLPRIFEKGYTGNNGRTDRTASGLGLYLCKRISESLRVELTADSELSVGTEIRVRFLPQMRH